MSAAPNLYDGRLRGLRRLVNAEVAANGGTMAALAERLDVHPVMLYRLAACSTGAALGTAQRIAAGLGCTLDDLVSADLPPPRRPPVETREISIHVVAETASATAALERLMSQARAVAEAATLARRAVDDLAAAELQRDLGDPPEALQ